MDRVSPAVKKSIAWMAFLTEFIPRRKRFIVLNAMRKRTKKIRKADLCGFIYL